jgi:hypothetical protein
MRRAIKIVVFITLALITKASLASTTLFVYRDLAVVESETTNEKVLIPKESYDLEIFPKGITVIEENETNYCIDKDLFSKYLSLSNEISTINNEISQIFDEISIYSNKMLILIEMAKSVQSSKDIDTYFNKSESIQKEIIVRENKINDLRKEVAEKIKEIEKITPKIKSLTFSYRELILSGKPQKISYKINGQWSLKYVININENTARLKVKLKLPKETSIGANEVFITTSQYTPEIVNTELLKLYGYLREKETILKYSPKGVVKSLQESPSEEIPEEEPESPQFEEIPSSYNITWNIKGNFSITNQYELLLDKLNISTSKNYLAIPSKYKNGLLVLEISNTSPLTLLPGEIEINLDKETSKGLYLKEALPQNGVFRTDGIVVEELTAKKELLQDRIENPGILGGNVKNLKSFKNIIKNSTSEEITLQVLERLPIASDNRININITQISPKPNEEMNSIKTNSIFSWTIKLKPNEEKELIYSYSVEYPKNLIYYEEETE